MVCLQEVEGGGGQDGMSNERDEFRCGCVQGEARDFQAADLALI